MTTRKEDVPWELIDTKDYDWNTYRTEFITTKITYEKLSEKYGLNPGHVRKRSSREGWMAKRKEFSEQHTQAVGEEVLELAVKELAKYNTNALKDAERLREAARRMFMVLDKNGKWSHRKDVPYGALGAAASAMVAADKIARLSLGGSTENNNNRNTNRNLPVSIEELV